MVITIAALLLQFALIFTSNADPIVCPRIGSTDMSVILDHVDPYGRRFNEISGIAFSPAQTSPSGAPLLYAHNDSGDSPRFGVFDSKTGKRVRTYRLPVQSNKDFESMTTGSCGVDFGGADCIYVADVGDNTAQYSSGTRTQRSGIPYRIFKIKEPRIEEFEDNAEIPASYVKTLNYDYMHETSPTLYADCEAVFLDPVGWGGGSVGDLYILTKWDDYDPADASSLNRLFKIPASAWSEDLSYTYSPAAVGYYGSGIYSNTIMGPRWTRAEMTQDGTVIALGSYYFQYIFLRCPGKSVAETLAVPRTAYCGYWPISYWDSQFETIAWSPDKTKTLEISEGGKPPLVWTTMDYTYIPGETYACPDTGLSANPVEKIATPVPTAAETEAPTTADQTQAPTMKPNQAPTASLSMANSTLALSRAPTHTPSIFANAATNQTLVPSTAPMVVPNASPNTTESTLAPSTASSQTPIVSKDAANLTLMPSVAPMGAPTAALNAANLTLFPSLMPMLAPYTANSTIAPSTVPSTVNSTTAPSIRPSKLGPQPLRHLTADVSASSNVLSPGVIVLPGFLVSSLIGVLV